MKQLLIALTLIATLLAPASAARCRVDIIRGRAYLVCPCKRVTYTCTDYYRIPVYRGRISVR